MKVGEIEKLLDKFYEGKTTEEQEEMLRNYFESEEVPEQFSIDKTVLLNCRKVAKVTMPSGLQDKLIKMIDEKADEEKHFMVRNRTIVNWKWIGSVAAGILLIVGLGFGISNLKTFSEPKDTYTNPQEAYDAVQAALIEISSNLNDGMAQFIEVRQDVDKIKNEIISEIQ